VRGDCLFLYFFLYHVKAAFPTASSQQRCMLMANLQEQAAAIRRSARLTVTHLQLAKTAKSKSILSRAKLPPPRSEITKNKILHRAAYPLSSSRISSTGWASSETVCLDKPFLWVRFDAKSPTRAGDADVWSANPVRPRHLPSGPVPRTTIPPQHRKRCMWMIVPPFAPGWSASGPSTLIFVPREEGFEQELLYR
jgi:hypothetical protein